MKEINSLDTKIESLNLEQIKVEEKCKGFKESIKNFLEMEKYNEDIKNLKVLNN